MLFDLALVALLAVFVAIGAWRGAIASFTSLAGLAIGYVAGFQAALRGGEAAARTLGVAPALGPLVAGTAGFVAALVLVGVAGFFAKRWDAERRGGLPRSGLDRVGGAVFGGLRGAVLAALLAWLGMFAAAAREVAPDGPLAALPSAEGSLAAGLTEVAVEQVVEGALGDDPASRVIARVAARPGERLRAVQTLLDDPRVRAVQEDAFFWTLVENGASERALNRMSFYRIAHDPEMRATFADLGFVSAAAAGDSNAFRDELRVVLDVVGARIKGIKQDPEIQALARDPEILAMLESGNTFGLVAHPRIQALASRLAADAPGGGTAAAGEPAPEAAGASASDAPDPRAREPRSALSPAASGRRAIPAASDVARR